MFPVMTSGVAALLGKLTQELVLVCDEHLIVHEMNSLAIHLLGEQAIGKPLVDLFLQAARTKGHAFATTLTNLPPGAITESWELLLDIPNGEALLVTVRGASLEEGGWLLVASRESPQLMALYHELLAMNNELTTVIRKISKEQTRLLNQLERLNRNESQEHRHER